MATMPDTAPEMAPSREGLPLSAHSASNQVKVAMAVATQVLTSARPAMPLASREEPALKPNQPTHSRQAPIIDMVKLCGAMDSRPKPTRLPTK